MIISPMFRKLIRKLVEDPNLFTKACAVATIKPLVRRGKFPFDHIYF